MSQLLSFISFKGTNADGVEKTNSVMYFGTFDCKEKRYTKVNSSNEKFSFKISVKIFISLMYM